MVRCALTLTLVAFAFTGVCAHAGTNLRARRARSFLSSGMQPEVVARTLASVEEEWKAQAGIFVECNGSSSEGDSVVDCAEAPKSFARSCSTVVNAVVQGSNGDRDVAKEYMEDVCGESSLKGWRKGGCLNLAIAMDGSMTADSYENRMNFDSQALCSRFWSSFLDEEKKRVAEEKAEQEEQDRKAAEDAAAAAKKAQEEAAAEAERKKKEEETRKAQAAAAEAAERMAQKKLEADEVTEEAKKKLEEAAAAEKQQQELQAKATPLPPVVKKGNNTAVEPQNTPAPVPASNASSPKDVVVPSSNETKKVPEAATVAAVAKTPEAQPSNKTK